MTAIIVLLLLLCGILLVLMFRPIGLGGSWFTQLGKPPNAPPESAIEVLELATEVLEKIDVKIDTLEKLLKEADDKIKGLRTINTAASRGSRERGAASHEHAVEHNLPAEHPRSDKRNMVIHLARRGLSSADIAQETGLGAGEVEFILNIEKNRKPDGR
ncbi:MAG: hypothetical protein ABIH66_03735 [bacterium]